MSRRYSDEHDDSYVRGRSSRREHSPQLPPFRVDDYGVGASSGRPTRGRYDYDDGAFRGDSAGLHVPASHYRPRSLPPQQALVPQPPSPYDRAMSRSPELYHRNRDHERSRDKHNSRSRDRGPIEQAFGAVDKTFSRTTSGVGVGLLGAVVGGFAAREASYAALKTRSKKEMSDAIKGSGHGPYRDSDSDPNAPVYNPPHPRARRSSSANRKETDMTRLVTTVVGALVGGLGANAIERRFEDSRQRHREEQEAWEKKWCRSDERHAYDHGNESDQGRGGGRDRRAGGRKREDAYNEESQDVDRRKPRRIGSEEGYYKW